MPALPPPADQTLDAADRALKAVRDAEPKRGYLGCSSIGHDCRRALWYAFRSCDDSDIGVRGYCAIEDGERGERVIIDRLRRVADLTLHDVDPSSGQQFAVSAVGGHLRGHLDGAVLGLLQAPKTWAVFEAKVCNEKKFAQLVKLRAEDEKGALRRWDPIYHAQAQAYMGLTGMTRHWLVCATPGVRDWTAVRTEFDADEYERLMKRAEAIITAPEPLERLSEKPEFYTCKWCNARAVCHEKRIPAPSCRTCVHATPELDGDARWSCALHKCDLTIIAQRHGCPDHVYIPQLVPLEFVGGDEAGNYAEYRRPGGAVLRNGSGDKDVYTSAEVYAAQDDLTRLDDTALNWLRINMGGRLESVRPEPPHEFDDYEQVRQALPLASEKAEAPF